LIRWGDQLIQYSRFNLVLNQIFKKVVETEQGFLAG
jgi:hypothetical protein